VTVPLGLVSTEALQARLADLMSLRDRLSVHIEILQARLASRGAMAPWRLQAQPTLVELRRLAATTHVIHHPVPRSKARQRHLDPAEAAPTIPPASTPVEEDPVDVVVVDRAAADDQVAMTRTERAAAITRMAAQGLSDAQIADRLHVTSRTVLRVRQSTRIASRWVA